MQVPTTALPSPQVLFRPLAELRITAAVRNIIDPNEARDITKSGHPDMVILTQLDGADEGAARAVAREAGFKSHDAAETPSSSTQPREAPPPPARVNEGVKEGVKEDDPVAMLVAMGFSEAAVVEELRLNRGAPDRAAQFLWAQVSATLIATDDH